MNNMDSVFIGVDCLDIMKRMPPESIDAIITSPPYAMQRKDQYGGIPEQDYPQWTVDWMHEVKRILKPTGNVAIVIRPHIKDGQISDYTLKTRLALREDGWNEAEELIWIKPVSPALGSKLRPRRSWESIHWFSKSPQPYCNPTAAGKPSKNIGLEKKKGVGDYIDGVSKKKDGIARVQDYVSVGTNMCDRSEDNTHPAQYPVELAEWLIQLLCPEDGTVLDPFLGSGTTAVAAQETGRDWYGIEQNEEYRGIIEKRISEKYIGKLDKWVTID